MKQILYAFCPYCKSPLILKKDFKVSGKTKARSLEKAWWSCRNDKCHHSFQHGWFQRFNQYDKFLILKGQDVVSRVSEIKQIEIYKSVFEKQW